MKFRFGVFNIVFLFLLTIGTSYGQQYPAATQVKYPMNLYSQADTKGVLVIGSGAPSFTPKAKQSRVYVDSVAGNIYCRKNDAWLLVAGSGKSFFDTNLRIKSSREHEGDGYDLKLDSVGRFTVNSLTSNSFSSPMNEFVGATFKVVGGNLDFKLPSRAGTPDGSILMKTAGDTLVYSAFGFKAGVPNNNTILYFDTSTNQYKSSPVFAALLGPTEYDSDALAAAGGVSSGSYYVLSATNIYSMPRGTIKKVL
jgi:hypothetical protein